MNDAVADLDLADPDFLADPYPTFAALRERAAVQWHEPTQMWLALSHRAASDVLRSRALGRVWSPRFPEIAMPAFELIHVHSLLENEPPVHTRLRRLIAGAFSRGHVERLRPAVTTHTSPGAAIPASRARRSASWITSSSLALPSLSSSTPVTPQFIANARTTEGERLTPRIEQRGRYFEIERAVRPDSVSAMIAAAAATSSTTASTMSSTGTPPRAMRAGIEITENGGAIDTTRANVESGTRAVAKLAP